jgi:hypothetical protein
VRYDIYIYIYVIGRQTVKCKSKTEIRYVCVREAVILHSNTWARRRSPCATHSVTRGHRMPDDPHQWQLFS